LDIASLPAHFPATENVTYLNTPATGLLSQPLLEWRREHDCEFLLKGSGFKAHYFRDMQEVRQTGSDFFDGEVARVSLVQNFTLGLNTLVRGLASTEKVLVFDCDYPSLRWPFKEQGCEVVQIPIDTPPYKVLDYIHNVGITVFAFSLVQYLSGIPMDLEFVKEIKSRYPEVLLIADGTQFCGTQDFSFADSGIDILGASAYKWMLGGFGCGFFMHKEGVEDRFHISQIGYHAARYDMQHTQPSLAARLEPGHLDTLNFGSMAFSLRFLGQIGKQKVATHLNGLSEKTKDGLAALGLLDQRIGLEAKHTTIYNVAGVPGLDGHLKANGVVCAPRGHGVRVGFHIYNTSDDVDRFLGLVKAIR
jgi:selenocysteine lyase/cysteine desulfurase